MSVAKQKQGMTVTPAST
jgi:hypothetical protein